MTDIDIDVDTGIDIDMCAYMNVCGCVDVCMYECARVHFYTCMGGACKRLNLA